MIQMPDEQLASLRARRGLIATVITTGTVDSLFAQCHEDMRALNITSNFPNIEYKSFDAKLVEAGRDAAVQHALANNYDFCVQIDADATFPPDAFLRLLHTAFNIVPDSDMVGAYCQLKGGMNISTLDTGSGTWEVHYPGEGIIPVIRTGAHFILCKKSAFAKMGAPPWFRTRHAPRALDVLYEIDGMARQQFSNKNPFADTKEWNELLEKAAKNAAGGPSSVGEDSGFADRLKASGGNIYVDCNIVTGHVSKKIISPHDLKDAVEKRQRMFRLVCGWMD